MASGAGIPIFDADNHLYETTEAFTRHLPARYKGAIQYVNVAGRTKIAIGGKISELAPAGGQSAKVRIRLAASPPAPEM